MKKINQISALLFFIAALSFTGCSVVKGKGCGCPMVHKKSVG